MPTTNALNRVKNVYKKHLEDDLIVTYLMLAIMNLDIQKQYEEMDIFIMIENLKQMIYNKQALRGFKP